ncbi:MAG: hypothetical protein Q9159_006777 [Coniocarpon cinnabarinum]
MSSSSGSDNDLGYPGNRPSKYWQHVASPSAIGAVKTWVDRIYGNVKSDEEMLALYKSNDALEHVGKNPALGQQVRKLTGQNLATYQAKLSVAKNNLGAAERELETAKINAANPDLDDEGDPKKGFSADNINGDITVAEEAKAQAQTRVTMLTNVCNEIRGKLDALPSDAATEG